MQFSNIQVLMYISALFNIINTYDNQHLIELTMLAPNHIDSHA